MARRKTLPDSVRTKYALAERLASLRQELFGDRGGPELARRLGLPVRTWYNYESGVTVPAEVVLKLIEMTSVEPSWLLHGAGSKYRGDAAAPAAAGRAHPANALLRKALEILEREQGGGVAALEPVAASGVVGATEHGRADARPGPFTPDEAKRLADPSAGCCVRVAGDDMAPIATDGAYVAFSEDEEPFEELHGQLVVAWLDGEPLVRWFERHGRYAVLKAENAGCPEPQRLVDLTEGSVPRLRRVRWINTHH